jgi:hypothetical protein
MRAGRPLNASVRLPNLVPLLRGNARMTPAIDSALRFRGPRLAACLCLERGVQTVTVSVASRHSVCEARCVNPRRSCDHKVPRSRAPIAVVLRGSARSSFSAGSPWIKLAGVRRWVGGKAPKSADLGRGPSDRRRCRRIHRWLGTGAASETQCVGQSNNAFERPLAASARAEALRPAAQRER